MQIGLFTPIFAKLAFVELLRELKRYPAVRMLEIGTGGWPGASHIELEAMLSNPAVIQEYRDRLADAGLGISAFSCHGDPVHPSPRSHGRTTRFSAGL